MTVVVTHNAGRQRFEATVDGQLCVADYQLRGNVMWMMHTGVPSAVGGRGIAAELVRVALAWAEQKKLDEAAAVHRRLGCPVIDVTELSVEETAMRIIKLVEQRRRTAAPT